MENVWRSIPKSAPFILDQDKYIIKELNYLYGGTLKKIQTQMLPEPFIGDINAQILILTKNPGFDEENDLVWHTDERLQRLAMANLHQEKSDYPFYFLNPEIEKSPGAKWHYGKLKELIKGTSLENVANNVCSIPSFPYHTEQFSGIPKKVSDEILPSQRYTRYLIREAIKRQAVIIMASGKKEWETLVPGLAEYSKRYLLHSNQSQHITSGNFDEFEMLVNVLKD